MVIFGFLNNKATNRAAPQYESVLESADGDMMTGLMVDPATYVSAQKALLNSDLYATIYQLSADLATCRIEASQPRTQTVIDHPSATTNRQAFWQSMAAQLLLDGNAYAYIWRNQLTGQPVRLEYLRPSQVSVFLLSDGTGLTYNVSFDEPSISVMNNVPQSDMIHLRLLGIGNGGEVGRSPLLALQNELNIKNSTNGLTISALSKAITSNGTLTAKNGSALSLKEKQALSAGFMAQATSNKGPVVLDELTTYAPLELNSDVSKLLSSTDWTSKQIAKVYNVPDSYLNGQGDQQSSLSMIEGMYANSLNRYAQAIVSEINEKFSANIDVDIQPAIDQDGSRYLAAIGGAVKNGAISGNQSDYLFRRRGILPASTPQFNPAESDLKGGDTNGSNGTN